MADKTTQLLLELAIGWEMQACDLYAKFAKLFSHEPKVSAFWKQLSKDESRHKEVLKDFLKEIPREKLLAELGNEQQKSVVRVERLINEATTSKIQTLDDAYELARQLETSEINKVFKMLVNDYMPDKEGHKFILADVKEHVEMFVKFGKEYTQSHRRRINVRSV
jgi:rubrerythrin